MAQKAIGLVINETKEKIANVINSSGLPASITSLILQGFLAQSSMAEKDEIEYEKKEYDKQVEAEQNGEGENDDRSDS